VLAYDKYKKDYSDSYAKEDSLEEIFAQSDVLSFHVPLTEETKFMANASFFDKFSKPFYLINTSRGKVVKTKDLLEAIRAGKIKGAGLDVLEFEAFSNEFDSTSLPEELKELFLMDNVVFSPHVAGWTVESYYKLPYYLAEKIINLFK
jgi:D-3-phosphoglycerate dehydrogenase